MLYIMDNKLGLFGGYEYIERAQNNNNTTKFKAGGFNPEMEQNVSKDALGIHEELEGGKNKKYSLACLLMLLRKWKKLYYLFYYLF